VQFTLNLIYVLITLLTMGYKYKDGYQRNVKQRGFSLSLDVVERMSKYDEINWSRVVSKLLSKYLDQLDRMEDILIVGDQKEEFK